ncbi:MAG TPA: patatin-like phospholipase family protein [Gammaproteobacteria bacterium]|nr:patatin-like phospholipase family protein [Gammaproteobacteria bacterium]
MPRLGLVLGSGAARGWAHVGVVRALERAGVRPDLVCGTSVGALVGAAYAGAAFDRFCESTAGMRRRDVLSFADLGLDGGLLKGQRFMAFVGRGFEDRPIEELPIPFAAVATSLENGAEVWLRKGSTLNAVRASLAIPGLFTPVQTDDGILVDGALVNPVPVSLARAMGADVVIAVDLSYGIIGRNLVVPDADASDADERGWLRRSLGRLWRANDEPRPPSLLGVVAASLDIMQVRITRSRMAGEPPDVIVAPRLAHIGLLDFDRAEEAIREGERAMEAALDSLAVLGIETAACS